MKTSELVTDFSHNTRIPTFQTFFKSRFLVFVLLFFLLLQFLSVGSLQIVSGLLFMGVSEDFKCFNERDRFLLGNVSNVPIIFNFYPISLTKSLNGLLECYNTHSEGTVLSK